MDRVQRTLGYLGTLLLVTGVVITVVGPAQFGIADDAADAAADESADAAGTDAPVAAASAPDGDGSGTPAGGTASTPDGATFAAENRTSPPADDVVGDSDGG